LKRGGAAVWGCQTTKKKHRKNLGKKRREEKRRERNVFTLLLSRVSSLFLFLSFFSSLFSLSLSSTFSLPQGIKESYYYYSGKTE
jgi:hypothetical protein